MIFKLTRGHLTGCKAESRRSPPKRPKEDGDPGKASDLRRRADRQMVASPANCCSDSKRSYLLWPWPHGNWLHPSRGTRVRVGDHKTSPPSLMRSWTKRQSLFLVVCHKNESANLWNITFRWYGLTIVRSHWEVHNENMNNFAMLHAIAKQLIQSIVGLSQLYK